MKKLILALSLFAGAPAFAENAPPSVPLASECGTPDQSTYFKLDVDFGMNLKLSKWENRRLKSYEWIPLTDNRNGSLSAGPYTVTAAAVFDAAGAQIATCIPQPTRNPTVFLPPDQGSFY